MNVLSLFDGIGSGRIVLDRLEIEPERYFACEIDKNALKISSKNFPDIYQLGDVRELDTCDLPSIDLLLAGFPCIDLSWAGKKQGLNGIKSLEQYLKLKYSGFQFRGQSYLFWEVVRILEEIKPRWFLLENVSIPKKWKNLVSHTLGLIPYRINSSVFSAQHRERFYWTDIPIEYPENDSNLFVKDILDYSTNTGWLEGKFIPVNHKSYNGIVGLGGLVNPKQSLWLKGKINSVRNFRQNQRVYSIQGKCPTLCASSNTSIFKIGDKFRRLTVNEMERLQGLSDNYTKVRGLTNNVRIKTIGNGWSIPVITHILKGIV